MGSRTPTYTNMRVSYKTNLRVNGAEILRKATEIYRPEILPAADLNTMSREETIEMLKTAITPFQTKK